MSLIGGTLGIHLLNLASKRGAVLQGEESTAYTGKSKLEVLLGPHVWQETRGKTVLDFGCGKGPDTVELAERGAARVIGLDIRQRWLRIANEYAESRGVSHKCLFAQAHDYHEPVDVIVCVDSFEHFADPADVLRQMAALLKPHGKVLVSFGWPWYHPLGGHIFSVFPWAHLVFTEGALIGWRSLYKTDGARNFTEAGLNRMTIHRFQRLVRESPLRFASFEMVPIRRLARVHNALTREFTTATIRCTLVHANAAAKAVATARGGARPV